MPINPSKGRIVARQHSLRTTAMSRPSWMRPPDELDRRIINCVEALMDLDALVETRREEQEQARRDRSPV